MKFHRDQSALRSIGTIAVSAFISAVAVLSACTTETPSLGPTDVPEPEPSPTPTRPPIPTYTPTAQLLEVEKLEARRLDDPALTSTPASDLASEPTATTAPAASPEPTPTTGTRPNTRDDSHIGDDGNTRADSFAHSHFIAYADDISNLNQHTCSHSYVSTDPYADSLANSRVIADANSSGVRCRAL